MISVVIPTLNAEQGLAAALSALVPGVVDGLIKEVIIVDGGSCDRTLKIADQAGAKVVTSAPGRGVQLAAGGKAASGDWLLFLHADTVLEAGWEREAAKFCEQVGSGRRPSSAAAFRYTLDDDGFTPWALETAVGLRSNILRLPFGDQGLLLPKSLYSEIGGYREMALMEDVDIVRRLGRKRIMLMRAGALTSAARYKRDGYLARIARNQLCILLYACGADDEWIRRIYAPSSDDAEAKSQSIQRDKL